MLSKSLLVAALLASAAHAQTYTLSGCHAHGTDGVEYCYLPNGSEVPFTRTGTASTPTATAQTTAPASAAATQTPASIPASVTGCHAHGATQFCLANGTEWEVLQTPTVTPLPTAYTGCHSHGSDVFCLASDGSEVPIALEGAESTGEVAAGGTESHEGCHYHFGVPHNCGGETTCGRIVQDYDIGLRVGLIFVILATSAIAVFGPTLLQQFTKVSLNGIVFVVLKQFGTGVILSTAFVHLLTHAEMMFRNECLGGLVYEATASSIAMAGVFLSFIIEYIGNRIIMRRQRRLESVADSEQPALEGTESPDSSAKESPNTTLAALGHSHGVVGPDNHFNIAIMEAGIVFHSVLIGITLSVTPDSFYITLFVVIIFHQMFEGLALGTRIASLASSSSMLTKMIMATIFALITPIGMAIGTGVLSKFNGNDPSTIVAIGTLNALSAGILLWVGLVEMLAHDWMHGDMLRSGWMKATIGVTSMVVGMAIMSLLGKWA